MRSYNQKTNRLLFLALVGVLALNMPWSNDKGEQSTGFSLSSNAEEYPFKDCPLVDGKHVCEASAEYDGTEYDFQYDVGKVKHRYHNIQDGKTYESEQMQYTLRLKDVDGKTVADSCIDCIELTELTFTSNTNELKALKAEIESKIKETTKELDAKQKKAIKAAERRKKEQEEQEKLQADIAACKKDSDGERLRGWEKTECEADKLADLDEEEAERHFKAKVAPDLRQMIQTGDDESRELALQLLQDIREDKYSREISQQAHTMIRAAAYKEEIKKVAKMIASAPEGSQARLFYAQRLLGLNQQLQSEFGQVPQLYANMGRMSADTMGEYSEWQSTLTAGIQLAMENPNALLADYNGVPMGVIPNSVNAQSTLDPYGNSLIGQGRMARAGNLQQSLIQGEEHWRNVMNMASGLVTSNQDQLARVSSRFSTGETSNSRFRSQRPAGSGRGMPSYGQSVGH